MKISGEIIRNFRASVLPCTGKAGNITVNNQRLIVLDAMSMALIAMNNYLRCAKKDSFALTLEEISHFTVSKRDSDIPRLDNANDLLQSVAGFSIFAYVVSSLFSYFKVPYVDLMIAVGLALICMSFYLDYNKKNNELNRLLITEVEGFIEGAIPETRSQTRSVNDDTIVILAHIKPLQSTVSDLRYNLNTEGQYKQKLFHQSLTVKPILDHEIEAVKKLFKTLCEKSSIDHTQFAWVFPTKVAVDAKHQLVA